MTLRHKTVLAALALVAPAGGAAGAESPNAPGPQGPAGAPPGSVYKRPAQMPLCELGPGERSFDRPARKAEATRWGGFIRGGW
jgi:hypothetical protein